MTLVLRVLTAVGLAMVTLVPALVVAPAVDAAPPRDRFVGTWAGTIAQTGSQSYKVKVTVSKGRTGYRANVKYPQLLCGGVWDFQRGDSQTLHFVERIRYNGMCGDGVDISVTANSDGTLAYQFVTTTASGTGTLRPTSARPVGPGTKPAGHGLKQWPTEQGDAGAALMIWFGAAWRVGEWELGFPTWSSCIEQDLCIAGTSSQVGIVARGQGGFYTVDEFSVDTPARFYLRVLGYDNATIAALLA